MKDAITNLPINGATLTLMQGASTVDTDTSDVSGGYSVTPTAPGAYSLTASATGYGSVTVSVNVVDPITVQDFALTPVDLLSVLVVDSFTSVPIPMPLLR